MKRDMNKKDSNNLIFSYEGCINRKNYIINMLILTVLYIAILLIQFEKFESYINKYIYSALIWVVWFIKFIALVSMLSVVYRRIADFSGIISSKLKAVFVIFYLYPFFVYYCGNFLFSSMPLLIEIIAFSILIILPISIILTIIFAFIKSK